MVKEYLLKKMVQNILESIKMEIFVMEKLNIQMELFTMVKLKIL